jgi:DNA-binding CsgD family transcriptional regulator
MTVPTLPGSGDRAGPQAGRKVVGRVAEIRRIDDFLECVACRGAAMHMLGEAGVGKTALLDVAAERARQAGMLVLHGSGTEFEADIPYAGLNQVLLDVRDRVGSLDPASWGVLTVALGYGHGESPDRRQVGNAAVALLRHVSVDQPVLVLVDDAHWLDRASAAALGFVARHLTGNRIGLLSAACSGVASCYDTDGHSLFPVRPLNDRSSAALVDATAPGLPWAVRRRLLDEAQGNPLALIELPTVLSSNSPCVGGSLADILPLSDKLQAMFARRITGLPDRTRAVLLAAVFEGSGDLRPLREASGDPRLEVLAPAEECGLIRLDHAMARIAFGHPLIGSTIVSLSSCDDRRRAHRALARSVGMQLERRAWHLAEANPGPDEGVAVLLESVARRAMHDGDAVGAVAALTRAAELSPGPEGVARRLTEAAYIDAEVNGHATEAESLLVRAREAFPDSAKSLYAANATVFLLLNGDGHLDAAHRILADAIAKGRHGWDATDPALIESVYNLLLLCVLSGDPRKWACFHEVLAHLVPGPPDFLSVIAKTHADPVRHAAATLDEAELLLSSVATEQDPHRIVRTGMAAVYIDRLGDLRASERRVVQSARRGGPARRQLTCLLHLCLDDFLTGRWDECDELADEGLTVCREHGFRFFAWYFHYCKAAVAAGRGRFDQAQSLADKITRWAGPRGVRSAEVFAHHPRALAALGRGDFEVAFYQATAISPAGTLAPYTQHCLWVLLDVVESAIRTGRHAQARAHVEAMNAADVAAISPRLGMVQYAAQALIAHNDEAGLLFEQALGLPHTERWVYDRARIQLAYGEWLRRTKATSQARTLLQAAQHAFEGMGAEPWAARAAAELRATGYVAVQGVNPGAGQLTAQEQEVALLAASGLTNRQIAERLFLSPRTVGAHLYRAFPKLGVTSRAALRDALDGAESERSAGLDLRSRSTGLPAEAGALDAAERQLDTVARPPTTPHPGSHALRYFEADPRQP